jgi:hypothetical protein
MATVTGKKSTRTGDFEKQIGMAEFQVEFFNPSREELERLLGTEIENDPEYLGESKEGNTTLRLSVWLREVATKRLYNLNFFLEDKEVRTMDGNKMQYINSIGRSAYVPSEDQLTEKFTAHDYHAARVGEVDVVSFMDAWLDIERKEPYTLGVNWKDLMKGNIKEFKELQRTDLPRTICCLLTVRVREKDGEKKEYQSIYNKKFLPGYSIKKFRTTAFTEEKLTALRAKRGSMVGDKKVYLKDWENFAVEVTDPTHGCKDAFSLEPAHDYNPAEFVQAGNKVITETDSDY